MGLSKSENFTQVQNELSAVARVLAHPARIAILQHLLKVDQCIGGEIVEEIPLAQPTISRHLKELQSVGIIKGHIEGNRVNYCIDARRWEEVRTLLNGLFDSKVSEHGCC
jgi:DNA-binding transcriptional ArsR family regulator